MRRQTRQLWVACAGFAVAGFAHRGQPLPSSGTPVAIRTANTSVSYPAKAGAGQGRHIVFLAGDEEYRSEEGLPMLAKILSQRHGFKCTVLFSVDPDGTINPKSSQSLSNPAALDTADAVVMLLRFRAWPDEDMARFDNLLRAGKPIVALRTSTHAFNGFPKGVDGRHGITTTWVDSESACSARHGSRTGVGTRSRPRAA